MILPLRVRAVPNAIVCVLFLGSPTQVGQGVVGSIAVEVPRLATFGAFANEREQNEPVNRMPIACE
jgi:hypothetical protein